MSGGKAGCRVSTTLQRKRFRHLFLTWPALLLCACSGAPPKETPRQSGTTSSSPPSALPPGAFQVSALDPRPAGGTRYLARAGDACAFEFTIGDAKSAGKGQFDFAFAPAVLERRANADCSDFLRRLAPELGYRGTLPTPPRAKHLEISLTILGTHQSRSSDHPQIAGSFSSTPPGDWTATKLFLADGEGEEGLGEFSYKDADYATTVITELAKILLPEPNGV